MSKAYNTNEKMEFLRVQGAQTVRSSVLNKTGISATRLTRNTPNHGYVDQHVTEDAFMMAFQMHDYRGDLWVDGKNVKMPVLRQGQFSFYDYNRIWQANMRSEFDCINFHIPRASITVLEEDLGTRKIETLNIAPGANMDDPTVRGLALALAPAFDSPEQVSMLFFDHVGLALSTHIAVRYGAAKEPAPPPPGGLVPWQFRRATEMIDAQIDGAIQVAELARACHLSPSFFTRAFKLTTGMPPYQWMIRRRVEKAQGLLRSTPLPLSEIAYACGFVDQSHFTRVFSRMVGMSPGAWRKTVLA
uniref:AraC family transcriptional regulator n=1 Tax=Ruegeria sp. PR1b TaxID=185588 RepID=UPI00146AFD48|nr:AraC family transcriptional regulator [Ruegeria sp. PR1b]